VNLAMPVWDWGVYYEKILRSVLSGSFRTEEEERALNYYYGMKEGVVDVLLSKSLPSGIQKLALVLKSAIVHDLCYPFFGPLATQEGKTVLDSIGSTIPVEQVISMDWLLDNVVGEIPAYEQLNPEAQATVDQAGVEKAKKK
jgi:hypothetical protein